MCPMRDPHDALLDQIERIAQWHLQAADYHRHWAFEWRSLADRLEAMPAESPGSDSAAIGPHRSIGPSAFLD